MAGKPLADPYITHALLLCYIHILLLSTHQVVEWYNGTMIADIHITEKSVASKQLMHSVTLSVDDGEKVGIVGRNGVGKSTLFGMLAGRDDDYAGRITYRRGITVASTAQEHHGMDAVAVVE